MPRSSTTTSLWKRSAALLCKVCHLCGGTQPENLDRLIRAEARKLGLLKAPPKAPNRCPKCGGDLLTGARVGTKICESPACDYTSP